MAGKRWEQLEALEMFFSPEELIQAMVKAMSDYEFNEVYEYIAAQYDTGG